MNGHPRHTPAHEITCLQAVNLVTEYLDGNLPADSRQRFETHLAECQHCTEHVNQIRITVELTGQVRDEELAPAVREDLLNLYWRWFTDEHPRPA